MSYLHIQLAIATRSVSHNFFGELTNSTKHTSLTVLCLDSLLVKLCVFKVIKLDVRIRPVFADSVIYNKLLY